MFINAINSYTISDSMFDLLCSFWINFRTQITFLSLESYCVLVPVTESMILSLKVESNDNQSNRLIKYLFLFGTFTNIIQFLPDIDLCWNKYFLKTSLAVESLKTQKTPSENHCWQQIKWW